MSFSSKNDAESSRNFIKNLVLDPKHAKLNQNSDFGHVRTCQDLSRRTSTYFKPADILLFLSFYNFPFLVTNFMIFYKFICCTKQIHHFLIKSSVLPREFIIFAKSSVLLREFIIFMTSSVLLSKFISLQVLIAKPRFYFLKFQGLRLLCFYSFLIF